MKHKYEKMSRLILYSPFLFVALLLFIVSASSLVYNHYEYTQNIAFLTQEKEQLIHHGVTTDVAHETFDRLSKATSHNTENRTLIGVGVICLSLILATLFTYVVFRKLIVRIVFYQEELFKEKEKLEKMHEELQYANEQLSYQLYIDPLTQLHNRLALERSIKEMPEPKLILMDIDSFKNINEYYGSSVGDAILQDVASQLRGFAQTYGTTVYRIGADEFALLENAPLDLERYEELALALLALFKGRLIDVPLVKEPIEINVAIGFSLEEKDVFETASMALSEAKQREIDYLCYFKKIEHTMRYAEQIKWSAFVKEALANDAVVPYYQPIFNREGQIVKYECLVRLLNEREEAIPPGLFLGISKKVKRYADIEKVLIDKSFQEIANTPNVISLNLLARDMSDSNISNYVVEKLKTYNVAKQVVFEILEDESIESLERVGIFIDRVKRMGCKIAIDDFGTGYSNFSYLLKLKPDYIKIDGSLIKALDKDTNSVAIVSAIITFAQKLGIKTIAEYVHNARVYEMCLALGIDEFQGFYLGEPAARLKEVR